MRVTRSRTLRSDIPGGLVLLLSWLLVMLVSGCSSKDNEENGGFLTFTLGSAGCAEDGNGSYVATVSYTIKNIAGDKANDARIQFRFYGVPMGDPVREESVVCEAVTDLGDLAPDESTSNTTACTHSFCPESYFYYFSNVSGESGNGNL